MNGAEGKNHAGLEGWPAAGLRLWFTVFLLSTLVALSRCSPTATPITAPTTAELANGSLRIDVRPHGARISIDGLRSGTTPVSVKLPAGLHTVRVEANGYQPLVETVDLAGGEEIILDDQLVALEGSAIPTPTPTLPPTQTPASSLPDLVVKQVKIELEAPTGCMIGLPPLGVRAVIENVGAASAGPFTVQLNATEMEVPEGLPAGESITLWAAGYEAGQENRVLVDAASQVEESDEENNLFAQMVPIPTPLVTCTPLPVGSATDSPPSSPTPTPPPPTESAQPVVVREGQVTIPTYPYAGFLHKARNETYNMTYQVLDREAYQASNPAPREMSYRTLVVENEYLQLTFLPELGGRLYQVIYKPTGHNQTYRNPVLKPSPWGPPEQGWWLAAGGVEWCLPVEEHGYEWGMPWQATAQRDPKGVTVILRDTRASDRVRAEIAVRLDAGAAAFTIRPRLENPTGAPLPVKYWTNAMLAPGGHNAPSADLRFVLSPSITQVTIHSRGDDSLPAYNELMSWPIFGGRDMSRLGNWNRWLGLFENPALGGFMAVYDEGYDEGMVRAFPVDVAQGAKVFGFGWTDPIPATNWTDDGSSYVEMHGGPAPTFDHSTTLPAGGALQWTETWYPVAGLGRLCFANDKVALNMTRGGAQVRVDLSAPRPWSGTLLLLREGQEQGRQTISLQPGQPLQVAIPVDDSVPGSDLILRLEGLNGQTVAQVRGDSCPRASDTESLQ